MKLVPFVIGLAAAAVVACGEQPVPTDVPAALAAATPVPDIAISADQEYLATPGTSWGCGGTSGILSQSFTPAAPTLAAIDIFLRTGGSFPAAGVTTTLSVYKGGPTGNLIGSATAFVASMDVGTVTAVRFRFLNPLAVKRGAQYTMRWTTPTDGDAVLTWMGSNSPGGAYAGGTAFLCGTTPSPSIDLNFTTWRAGQ